MIAIKKKRFVILIIALMVFGMLITLLVGGLFLNSQKGIYLTQNQYKNMKYMTDKYQKTEELFTLAKNYYYLPIDDEDLMAGIYRGLFQGIGDPYSEYLTKGEYEDLIVDTVGEFEGVGVVITADSQGNILVVSTIEGGPAHQAGLITGDIIRAVDGKTFFALDLSKAAQALRGEKGSKVKITYFRDGELKEVSLTRSVIITNSVYSQIIDSNIGYIRITQFEKNTSKDFQKEYIDLEQKGAKAIIIDLRNNGGGVIDSAIEVADFLLPEATIIYAENREGKKEYYNSDSSTVKLPYILLINEGTASASEILAVAVKDNNGGKLLGSKSFGKGVVQAVEKLPGGDAIKVTIMQFFSPKGDLINGVGVKPDIEIEQERESKEDLALKKGIEMLKGN